VSLCTFVVYGG